MADNGVVLDKFATLATDSFRSLTLELCGYKTKMIEFIDTELYCTQNLGHKIGGAVFL